MILACYLQMVPYEPSKTDDSRSKHALPAVLVCQPRARCCSVQFILVRRRLGLRLHFATFATALPLRPGQVESRPSREAARRRCPRLGRCRAVADGVGGGEGGRGWTRAL